MGVDGELGAAGRMAASCGLESGAVSRALAGDAAARHRAAADPGLPGARFPGQFLGRRPSLLESGGF